RSSFVSVRVKAWATFAQMGKGLLLSLGEFQGAHKIHRGPLGVSGQLSHPGAACRTPAETVTLEQVAGFFGGFAVKQEHGAVFLRILAVGVAGAAALKLGPVGYFLQVFDALGNAA